MMLSTEFEMEDIGFAKRILGIEILRERNKGKLFLSQRNYIKNCMVLQIHGNQICNL